MQQNGKIDQGDETTSFPTTGCASSMYKPSLNTSFDREGHVI